MTPRNDPLLPTAQTTAPDFTASRSPAEGKAGGMIAHIIEQLKIA